MCNFFALVIFEAFYPYLLYLLINTTWVFIEIGECILYFLEEKCQYLNINAYIFMLFIIKH